MRMTLMLIMLLFSIFSTEIHAETKAELRKELAIVIDDFGNNMKGTDEMLALPIPITAAIMPFLSTTERDAKLAHEKGHEVIVHLPMEPKSGKKSWLGPGAITTDMSDKEIREQVEKAIEAVPHAVGMNHHMGSKATEDERVMRIVLEVCKEKGLFYLDSRTSSKSVVAKVADELSVPYLENDLFFDHIYTEQYINKQAARLMKQLNEEDQLIAIGHVGITGEQVVGVLKAYIPKYEEHADIVPLSTLIPELRVIDKKMP
ncbi:divergent polysaccharide deacetylase family protein [Bacillus tuaregi]|uniref:divergent polysaccharide deacetylase family protein n=1 Tax=Bacillus tuaregi TaxID=1816695 RepID=UPI0008F8D2FA|nr:divergent polysaccharide deacetylase family protein [Bacillus tuaregi]